MPSSKKTENFGLNQWQSTDIPKRQDFVDDNRIIDSVISAHAADNSKHFSTADRERFNHPIECSFYVGDGKATRTIELGYKPSLFIIFPDSYPMGRVNFDAKTRDVDFAIGCGGLTTFGATIVDNGIIVEEAMSGEYGTEFASLNKKGKMYVYVVLK